MTPAARKWFKAVLAIATFQVIRVSAAGGIPCQLIDDIEETDPVNRSLKPAFYRLKRCKGGSYLLRGFQCQASSTETKVITVFNRLESSNKDKQFISATACHEVCVCGRKCNQPKTGICGRGLTWNKDECRCECDFKYNVMNLSGEKGSKRLPLRYLVVSILAVTLVFLIAILIIVCYYRRRNQYHHKYRYYATVQWNKQMEEELDYVDSPSKAGRKSRWFCCRKTDNPTDDLTSIQCFEKGHRAFKRDNYREMLDWMLKALKRWEEKGGSDGQSVSNNFQYDLYQHLSIAYLAHKSWNIEKADEYKRKALQVAVMNEGKSEGTNGGVV